MDVIDKVIKDIEYVLNKAVKENRTVFVYSDIRKIINDYRHGNYK